MLSTLPSALALFKRSGKPRQSSEREGLEKPALKKAFPSMRMLRPIHSFREPMKKKELKALKLRLDSYNHYQLDADEVDRRRSRIEPPPPLPRRCKICGYLTAKYDVHKDGKTTFAVHSDVQDCVETAVKNRCGEGALEAPMPLITGSSVSVKEYLSQYHGQKWDVS